MSRDNYGSNPEFDEDIVEEYRRASARGFDAPPAASLRETSPEEQFRWPAFDDFDEPARERAQQPRQPRREEFYREPEPDSLDFWGAPETKAPVSEQSVREQSFTSRQKAREEFNDAGEFSWPGDDRRGDTLALEREELTEVVSRPRAPQTLDEDTVFVGNDTVTGWALDIFGGELFVIPGNNVIIGRRPKEITGCQTLVIEDSGRTLSKSHARLFFEGGQWYIEDLGSTNGTALLTGGDTDGSSEQVLNAGERGRVVDRFRIGTLHVRLRRLVDQ